MKYSVLIADDEPHAREYLCKLVVGEENLDLIGVCESGNEVLKFCKTLLPDIILLDIQMPGKNGIDTALQLVKYEKVPLIIFTTAFDQYAIAAFDVEAIGYLLKPFGKDQFRNVLERAFRLIEVKSKGEFQERVQRLYERFQEGSKSHLTQFEIKEKGLIKTIPVNQVLYLSSDSEYVKIFTKEQFYIQRISIELLAKQLPSSFLRIHRSHVINSNHIGEWKYLNNSTYSFRFANGVWLKSSRSFQKQIRIFFSQSMKRSF